MKPETRAAIAPALVSAVIAGAMVVAMCVWALPGNPALDTVLRAAAGASVSFVATLLLIRLRDSQP